MDVAHLMTGWCPVHDRVYETADGFCPRCGTALVSETDDDTPAEPTITSSVPTEAPEEEIAPQPAARKPTGLIVGVAAVLVAFMVGLAFPQGPRRPAAPPALRLAKIDRNVGVTRFGAGVMLRLESFVQEGRHVVLRVTVPSDQSIDLGRIRSVDVEFTMEGDREIVPMPVRTTVSGFVIDGLALPRGETPVTGIRIQALHLAAGTISEPVALNLTGLVPGTDGRPVARSARGRIDSGDGRSISFTGLVGWPDRIELAVQTRGAPEGWFYDEALLLDLGIYGETRGNVFESVEGRSIVFFDFVPREAKRGSVRLSVESIEVRGNWRWVFPRSS